MVESEVANDNSDDYSSAKINIRSLLFETPSTSTHDSSGSSYDADLEVSIVKRTDGSSVYLLNDRVIDAQELAKLQDIARFKISGYEKLLDFTKMDIMKLQQMIELDRERLCRKVQQQENYQSLLDEARKLLKQLENLEQVSAQSNEIFSEIHDIQAEIEQRETEVAADLSLAKTAIPSIGAIEERSLPPQQLLTENFENEWSDAPSSPSLPNESSEIGVDGIQPHQVLASTVFDSSKSDSHDDHASDDGSNDADRSSVSSMNSDRRKREIRKRKSESNSVATEENHNAESTSSSTTPAKKIRLSTKKKSYNYKQLIAQFLVRDKKQLLEEYKEKKLEAEELREEGQQVKTASVTNLWVPLSAYLAKHNIQRDRKEARKDACRLCAMSVGDLTSKLGLTMDEANLLHDLLRFETNVLPKCESMQLREAMTVMKNQYK